MHGTDAVHTQGSSGGARSVAGLPSPFMVHVREVTGGQASMHAVGMCRTVREWAGAVVGGITRLLKVGLGWL